MPGPQTLDTDEIIANFIERIDNDGMLLFAQDIFPNLTTRSADLVLPAAGWGEMPGNRWNGERRLRLSDRFMDPPGEAKPDWWVIAEVAKKMGFSGYDWKDENEIFVAAAGLPTDYDVTALREQLQDESANHTSHEAVVIAAELQGKTAYDVMRELGHQRRAAAGPPRCRGQRHRHASASTATASSIARAARRCSSTSAGTRPRRSGSD